MGPDGRVGAETRRFSLRRESEMPSCASLYRDVEPAGRRQRTDVGAIAGARARLNDAMQQLAEEIIPALRQGFGRVLGP